VAKVKNKYKLIDDGVIPVTANDVLTTMAASHCGLRDAADFYHVSVSWLHTFLRRNGCRAPLKRGPSIWEKEADRG